MPRKAVAIHVSDFCERLHKLAVAEGEDFRWPGPVDFVAKFISQRSGLSLEEVYTYIYRAGHGRRWGAAGPWESALLGAVKQVGFDLRGDITEIAERMSAFGNTPDYEELLAEFRVKFPREADEMGLPKGGPSSLTDPVPVASIAKILPRATGGGRSDKLAERLKRAGAGMEKIGGKWYVEREDAKMLVRPYRKWCDEHPDE